ncbi:MAG: HIT family protein [Chloroflexota bacterium]
MANTSSPSHHENGSRIICRLASGTVELYRLQFLPGYCVLRAEPEVESLNELEPEQQAQFLSDMALVGDALLEATGAYRINYAILCNTDPHLHAHIVPRYDFERDDLRKGLPWSYPDEMIDAMVFDEQRDRSVIERIYAALEKRQPSSPPVLAAQTTA